MVKVIIVEDNDTIRNGLKEFLNNSDKYKCVADYPDCESALKNLSKHQFDVILMDIILPGISGIEGIKEIKKAIDNPKIIVLTIYSESENLFEALVAGASGYLEKKTAPRQMLKVIGDINSGKSYMNTYIARKVLNYFNNKKNDSSKRAAVLEENEFDVLNSLIEGKSPKAIADFFKISSDKVHKHFFDIYQKLHSNYEFRKISVI